MELKLNLGNKQLLSLIKQLPANQLVKLKSELDQSIAEKEIPRDQSALQRLLIGGPVMTGEQFEEFQKYRKNFNKWRSK